MEKDEELKQLVLNEIEDHDHKKCEEENRLVCCEWTICILSTFISFVLVVYFIILLVNINL